MTLGLMVGPEEGSNPDWIRRKSVILAEVPL